MKKLLILGANGQLGQDCKKLFQDDYDVVALDLPDIDITSADSLASIIKKVKPEIVVNCAAWTNVDGAEEPEKYELVEKLNATAPENLAKAMKEVGGLLVHISTDYVFGAEPYNTPCKEDQKGTPTGVYGLTKLHGEQKIIATGCNHVIIRTAWLYSEFGKNFCKTMMNLTATKPELKVVFDQVGTPTYALDLAKAICVILADYTRHCEERSDVAICYNKSGIYHYSNEGVCSWFDFTKMIAEYNGTTECNVMPCYSCDFPSPVKRPSYSVLDKSKIKRVFGVEVPYWTDSLKKCINNLKSM